MPYKIYTNRQTKEPVEAVECGHPGELMETSQHFSEGDFIVRGPVNLLGKVEHRVVPKQEFIKQYALNMKAADYWKIGVSS